MIRSTIISIGILILCMSMSGKAACEEYNQLTDIKLKVLKGYSRIVLRTEKRTPYRVTTSPRDKTLTLEIPHSSLKLSRPVPELRSDMVEGVMFGSRSSGLLYVEIKLRLSRVEVTHFLYHNPPSIVINIREDKRLVVEGSGRKSALDASREEVHLLRKKDKPISTDGEKSPFREDGKLEARKSCSTSSLVTPEVKGHTPTKKEELVSKEKDKYHTFANRDVMVKGDEQADREPLDLKMPAIQSKKESDIHIDAGGQEDEDMFRAGSRLFEEHNYAGAADNFILLVKRFPSSKYAENAAFLIGDCHFEMATRDSSGRYISAIDAYRSALRLYPDSERAASATFRIGESHWRMNHFYESEADFSALINRYPKSKYVSKARLRLGESMLKNKKFTEALEVFKKLLSNHPDNSQGKRAVFGIGNAYYGLKDFKNARQHYRKATNRWPDYLKTDAETLFNVGETYFRNKGYREARKSFLELINIFPDGNLRGMALNRIGDTFRVKGKTEEALIFYSEVVSHCPDGKMQGMARVSMADIGLETPGLSLPDRIFDYDSYMMPLNAYKEVSERFPDSELGRLASLKEGLYYLDHERFTEAVSTLKRSMKMSPRGPIYWKLSFYMQKACVKAIDKHYEGKDYLSVIRSYLENFDPFLRDVVDGRTLSQVGESYRKLGLYSRAKEVYQRALQANPTGRYADLITFKTGNICYSQDNYKEAETVFRKFMSRFPESLYMPRVLVRLGDTLYRKGSFQEAADVYLSALQGRKGQDWEPRVYYSLANALEKIGSDSKAVAAYRDAILSFKTEEGKAGILPDFILESHIKIGDFLYDHRNYLEALKEYADTSKLLAGGERARWVSFRTAECYRKLTRKAEAIEKLERLAHDPGNEFWKTMTAYAIDHINWEERYKDRL